MASIFLSVNGTGPGGRIVRDDIAALLTGAPSAAPAAPAATETPAPSPTPAPTKTGGSDTVAATVWAPARRSARSAHDPPHDRPSHGRVDAVRAALLCHVEVDMAQAAALREQINAQVSDDAEKISFNDLILKAAALALREYPNLNRLLEDDNSSITPTSTSTSRSRSTMG